MDDLISRQEAIDKFEPWLKIDGYSEGELNVLKAVLYELRFLPSAQKTGSWDLSRCSNCGHMDVEEPTYCSRCGSYNGGENE